jgi:osmoprotectant transport system permease protein
MILLAKSTAPFVRWDWIGRHLDDIWDATVEHLALTGLAVGIGLAISLGLSLWSLRSARRFAVLTSVASVLYSLPSLSAFALLVPFFGLTRTTAVIPLVSYTLLILIRNIVTGIRAVDPAVREAALGMGYTRAALLWRVEMPLALPVIVAGLRIATVTVVGLVTVASLIGYGGLGGLILSGLRRSIIFPTEIVVGTVGAIVLAAALDGALLLVQRLLTPWRRAAQGV